MSYTNKKAIELAYISGLIDKTENLSELEKKMVAIIEGQIKIIMRDTRHKCAENICHSTTNGIMIDVHSAQGIVMNANLD